MTTITIDRAVVEQALHVAENAGYPLALIKALRAALAQEQAEPVQMHPSQFAELIKGKEAMIGAPVYWAESRTQAAWKMDYEERRAEQAEPVKEMPSNTRYTVAVEGQALTYWDNIHDAITNAQRAVYANPDATTRAIDDLRAGRLAEWSYGFSAVRIYPPQEQAEPAADPFNCPKCGRHDYGLHGACPTCDTQEQAEPVQCSNTFGCRCPKHYTAPPKAEPLTDEEAAKACGASGNLGPLMQIVRAIERALEEKNRGR